MPSAIKVENLSKIYRLGEIGTGTLSRDVHRWFTTKIRGQEDPFLKIGQNNDRTSKGENDIVYSLKDINFEIEQGDAVGIIGRNGAGKSTLLKILSRVTAPTTGKIRIKGRIASLLEVGTGFHPELTGRENIYLNGAILGMRKKEITRKLDEIIDFSGVERYIDTPVKRYSSGMYVRLAFAVAAHLESEILIIDEVLAVGDAEFQKRCLGKMSDVSKGDGRTILFVSHNMGAISTLCSKAILLNQGIISIHQSTEIVIDHYLNNNNNSESHLIRTNKDNKDLHISEVAIRNNEGVISNQINSQKPFSIEIIFNSFTAKSNLQVAIRISNHEGIPIFTTTSNDEAGVYEKIDMGQYCYTVNLPELLFKPGLYRVIVAIFEPRRPLDSIEDEIAFNIEDIGNHFNILNDGRLGIISPLLKWTKEKKDEK